MLLLLPVLVLLLLLLPACQIALLPPHLSATLPFWSSQQLRLLQPSAAGRLQRPVRASPSLQPWPQLWLQGRLKLWLQPRQLLLL
jgi:hypothetical protein